jgi:uncharacterized protein (DUF1330 family)
MAASEEPKYNSTRGPVIVKAMRAAGGRFLARGLPAHAFESGLMERTTLIEFDSVDAAVVAFNSPAYQHALRVLDVAAERDLRIIEVVSLTQATPHGWLRSRHVRRGPERLARAPGHGVPPSVSAAHGDVGPGVVLRSRLMMRPS